MRYNTKEKGKYHSLFCAETVPRLANHFGKLSFPVWVHRLELVMLFCKEEVIAAPIWFWVVGVTPSSVSPPPTRTSTFGRIIRYNGATIMQNWCGRTWWLWMVKHTSKSLRTQFHRYQITTVKLPFDCSHCRQTWNIYTKQTTLWISLASFCLSQG